MNAVRAVEVLLDRSEERRVGRELHDGAFRPGVELVVGGQLGEERLEPAFAREHRHAQKQLPRGVVLRDLLQRFEVFEQRLMHGPLTAAANRWLRSGLERLYELRETVLVGEVDLEAARPDPRGQAC